MLNAVHSPAALSDFQHPMNPQCLIKALVCSGRGGEGGGGGLEL